MSSKGSFKVKTSKTSPRRKRIKRTNSRSITKHTKKIQIGGALNVANIIDSSKTTGTVLKFITNSLNDHLPNTDATLKDNTLVKVRDNSVDKIFKYKRVSDGKNKTGGNTVYIFQHNDFIPFPGTVVATVYDIIKDTPTNKIKGYKLITTSTSGTLIDMTATKPIEQSIEGKQCVYRTTLKVGQTTDKNNAYLLFRRSEQNEKGNNDDNGNPNGIYQYWGEQGGTWKWINAV